MLDTTLQPTRTPWSWLKYWRLLLIFILLKDAASIGASHEDRESTRDWLNKNTILCNDLDFWKSKQRRRRHLEKNASWPTHQMTDLEFGQIPGWKPAHIHIVVVRDVSQNLRFQHLRRQWQKTMIRIRMLVKWEKSSHQVVEIWGVAHWSLPVAIHLGDWNCWDCHQWPRWSRWC